MGDANVAPLQDGFFRRTDEQSSSRAPAPVFVGSVLATPPRTFGSIDLRLMNPINLGLRFVLEVACLVGIGWASWHLTASLWRWLLAIAIPIVAAAAWGTFAVPDDPSRSGNAPVPVPGLVRLLIEFAVLGAGVAGFALAGRPMIAAAFAVLIVGHYVWSYERIIWLLGR